MNFVAYDPLAVRLIAAVHSGALDELARLLNERPDLANAHMAGRRGGWRTPLHLVTDWPGYFPNGPEVVRLLIQAGADPSAPSDDGPSETPLHWAASSDDVEVAAALIDSGADIDARRLDRGRRSARQRRRLRLLARGAAAGRPGRPRGFTVAGGGAGDA